MRIINVLCAFSMLLLMSFSSKSSSHGNAKIQSQIEQIRCDSSFSNATLGVSIINCSKNETIVSYNSNVSLIPASTYKIITTAAGLCLLGQNFVYTTNLYQQGYFDSTNGVFNGNLIIRGSGDPTIESRFFKNERDTSALVKSWASHLKKSGFKTINGSIIADASAFDQLAIPADWTWGDIGNYYGAGAYGLSYLDNSYSIYFNSSKEGDSTFINQIHPTNLGLTIKNNVIAHGTEDSAYIFGSPFSNFRYVSGTIPPYRLNYEIKGSLPDPPMMFAVDFANQLSKFGIQLNGNTYSRYEKYLYNSNNIVLSHHSPTLDKIVYWTNLHSYNLYAEHILKTIALKEKGIGNEAIGIECVLNFLKLKGVNIHGMNLVDGCGLARTDNVTCGQLTQILGFMINEKCFHAFFNSLPIAGETGTMKNYCKNSMTANKMRAKTGSFSGVRSFAGYVQTQSGDWVCFAIILNNFNCSPDLVKSKLNQLLISIAEIN